MASASSMAAFVLETAEILKAGVISHDRTPSATMQTELDMDGSRVVSVGNPTDPRDAATKTMWTHRTGNTS